MRLRGHGRRAAKIDLQSIDTGVNTNRGIIRQADCHTVQSQ